MSTHSKMVKDVDTAQFESAVIERSRQVPVLVDFWAAWCGPCRTLGPVLEAAVAERGGEVELVKVDVDANQELAGRYQVRGIPAVKAFVDGKVVDEFVGAQDRRAVDIFISRVVPPPEAKALAKATAAIDGQRYDEAEALLAPLLENAFFHDQAQLLRARALAERGDVAGARACLASIDSGSSHATEATAMGARIELTAAAAAVEDDLEAALARLEGTPDDHALRHGVAGMLLAAGRIEDALEHLLELVQRDRKYGDDAGRRGMLAIFDAEGPQSDLARDYRRRLQIYL
ncbi:MAG: thioredoxin [Myxococcales bacterium]|nr:thioredoxin [Myxococcales bacterium]